MKLSEIKKGDKIVLDDGFICHGEGVVEVLENENGLYFVCDGGEELNESTCHYLDGQIDKNGDLEGVSFVGQGG